MSDRPDVPAPSTADDDLRDDAVVQEDEGRQPVFNLPGVLTATVLLLAGIYLVDAYLLSDIWREWLLVNFAFIPLRYLYPFADEGMRQIWTPFTYSLMHGSMQHLLFNGLWLVAFGAPVVRRIGAMRYLVFWVLSAAVAAFFHAGLNWGEPTVLIGASGMISALMGAACRFAFPRHGGYDRTFGHLYPRQSIIGSLQNRTVAVFVGLWFAGNILVAVGLPLIDAGSDAIAWDAHIGGFLFGYLLFGLFDRVR